MEVWYKYRFNFFSFINETIVLIICFTLSFILIAYIYGNEFILQDVWMLPLLIVGWYFSSRTIQADDNIESKSIIAGLYKTANSIFVQFFLVILFFFTSNQTNNSKKFLIFYILLL